MPTSRFSTAVHPGHPRRTEKVRDRYFVNVGFDSCGGFRYSEKARRASPPDKFQQVICCALNNQRHVAARPIAHAKQQSSGTRWVRSKTCESTSTAHDSRGQLLRRSRPSVPLGREAVRDAAQCSGAAPSDYDLWEISSTWFSPRSPRHDVPAAREPALAPIGARRAASTLKTPSQRVRLSAGGAQTRPLTSGYERGRNCLLLRALVQHRILA